MLGLPPHITFPTPIDVPPEVIAHIFLNPTEVMESPGKTRCRCCAAHDQIDAGETGIRSA